jgi:MFS transporter, PAT family, beta-lactamase induction signal transducer AmpG
MVAVASAIGARPSLALSEHRNLRFCTLFLLYVAQGLPFGLIDFALPAWLAQNGASAAAIGGVLAMIILPWTFKLPYGFIMDRYAFLAMGRRRPWIIVGQAGLVAALVAMAITNPDVQEIGLIAALAFAMGLGSAFQDVAVDGLAVDILPADEIERVNGYMFGGQAIGVAAGAAVSGYLIAYHGLSAAALALAAMIAAILVLVLVVRERPDERLLPWTKGVASQRNLDLHLGAFWPIIRNLFVAMFTRQTLILIPAFLSASAAWGIFLGLAPLFATNILGWEKAIYSGWVGQANLVAGLVCVFIFGAAASHWGARRLFIGCALMTSAGAAAMVALQGFWTNPAVFIGAIFLFTALTFLRSVTGGSLAMRLCTPAVAATQFAVFIAIFNLGRAIASASLGWLDSLGGIPAMFAAMAVCALVTAAFAFAAKVGR